MKRWLFRILLLLIGLMVLGAVSIELVLRSDYPRRMVLERLQRQTGLAWSVGSLRAGWGGQTVLRNLEVRLPLDDAPLFSAAELRVTHTPLLGLALGGMNIASIQIPRTTIDVVQENDGSLNVQRALDAIASAQPAGGGRGIPGLPRVDIGSATLRLTNRRGETKVIDDVSLHGVPADSLTWQAALSLAGAAEAHARLAPGGRWRHEVEFKVSDFAFAAHFLSAKGSTGVLPLAATGTWQGQLAGNALAGNLDLTSAMFERGQISGTMGLNLSGEGLRVDDLALDVHSNDLDIGDARLTGGPLTLGEQALRIEALHVSLAGPAVNLQALVHGQFGGALRSAGEGHLQVSWQAEHPSLHVDHAGEAKFMIQPRGLGEMRVSAAIDTRGRATALSKWEDTWDGRLTIDLAGSSDDLKAKLRAERFVFSPPPAGASDQRVHLGGAAIDLVKTGSRVRVSDLTISGAESNVRGEFNLDSGEWSLALGVSRWTPPAIERVPPRLQPGPTNVNIDAHGDRRVIIVSRFEVAADYISVLASGAYRLAAEGAGSTAETMPLDAQLTVTAQPDADWSIAPRAPLLERPPLIVTPAAGPFGRLLAAILTPPPVSAQPKPSNLRGAVTTTLRVNGEFQPIDLKITGEISGGNVPIDRARINRIDARIVAHVNREQTTVVVDSPDALGGTLHVDGALAMALRDVRATIDGSGIEIERALALIGTKIGGDAASGRATITGTLRMPGLDASGAEFDGQWSIADAAALDQPLGQVGGRLSMRNQVIETSEVRAQREDGSVITGHATYDIARRLLSTELQAQQWKVQAPAAGDGNLAVLVNASAGLQADLASGNVTGESRLTGDVTLDGQAVGPVRVSAALSDKTLRVSQLEATLLGGEVSGAGSIPLDHWQSSHAHVQWSGIALTRLGELWPAADLLAPRIGGPVRGTLDGSAHMMPAADPHSPEPLKVTVSFRPRDSSIGALAWEETAITAFIGSQRVLANASALNLAGGAVNAWARFSWAHDGPFTHVQATFTDVSLDQLVHVVDAESPPIPGLVSGRFAVGGYIAAPHRSFGQADIALRESDLANVPLISALYRTLNLRIDEPRPEGEGMLWARLDGDALDLTRLTYFNRGVYVVSRLRIKNLWAGAASPIDGFAVGALRPLKTIDLPLVRDIDTAMKVFQAGAGSVRITGTVGQHEIKAVPFNEITGAVRSALSGL